MFKRAGGFARNALLWAGGTILAGLIASCDNPYKGKTVEEIVAMVGTPKQAQAYIDSEIPYAWEDVNNLSNLPLIDFASWPESYSRLPSAANGADTQSFRETHRRKRGVCRDGAAAVAAMVQDDGIDSLLLSVHETNGSGHQVFIYNHDGKWGTAGINSSDFHNAIYSSWEDAARAIADQMDYDYAGFSVYDVSSVDLVNGTNSGLVNNLPFVIRKSRPGIEQTGEVSFDGECYINTSITHMGNFTTEKTERYTRDAWIEYKAEMTYSSIGTSSSTFEVHDRHDDRLPRIVEMSTIATNGAIEHCIAIKDEEQRDIHLERTRRDSSGHIFDYNVIDNIYNDPIYIMDLRRSQDGDTQIDYRIRITYFDDEVVLIEEDTDYDGVWDSITAP